VDLSEQVAHDQQRFLQDLEKRKQTAADIIRKRFQEVLSEPGSESVHAAKGAPPLRQTGRLLNSIREDIRGQEIVILIEGCPYAKYLEKNHPFWISTIMSCEPRVRQILLEGR
jgi:hypothetical protein